MSTVVLFDAVGTVIKPDPDVVSVYQKLGSEFGSRLPISELKTRIGLARRKYFQVGVDLDRSADQSVGQNLELDSSDEIELELWRQLVVEVFREIPQADQLFEKLWEHFRLPEHWQLYDDVGSCWDDLRTRGCLIGLASNFDSRLLPLCEAIPLLSTADFVFQSAGVGFRKPSPQFYREIETNLRESLKISTADPLRIYMVGDDLVNDCLGPNRAGWSGFWLNRSGKPMSLSGQANGDVSEFEQVDSVDSLDEFSAQVRAV